MNFVVLYIYTAEHEGMFAILGYTKVPLSPAFLFRLSKQKDTPCHGLAAVGIMLGREADDGLAGVGHVRPEGRGRPE